MSRRGDMFMLALDIIFLAAILLIFWKLSGAFAQPNPYEGIGTRQTALLQTYAVSEQMLLYLDEAGKFAAYESLANVMDRSGLLYDAKCGSYAGYGRWTSEDGPCFPPIDATKRDSVYAAFERELSKNIGKYMRYPGFPPGMSYTYELKRGNGLTIIALADQQVTLPIITAKQASQAATLPIILEENVVKSGMQSFTADTALQAAISPTLNRKPRTSHVTHVVIHSTRSDMSTAQRRYIEGTESVHYLIAEDGTLTQLVPEDQRAFHMPCETKECSQMEEQSISIALVNSAPLAADPCPEGREQLSATSWCATHKVCGTHEQRCWKPFTAEQITTLEALTKDIVQRRSIKPADVLLQEQIIPTENPGPALHGKGTQQQWYADLLRTLAAVEPIAIGTDGSSGAQQPQQPQAPVQGPVQPGQAPLPGNQPVVSSPQMAISLPMSSTTISSCYGDRLLHGRNDLHDGLDFAAAKGTAVNAIADGVVQKTCEEWVGSCSCSIIDSRDKCPAGCAGRCGNYGNNLIIKHSETLYSRYSHLTDIDVSEGQTVRRGQRIGSSGNTGASGGPHLDLKIYTAQSDVYGKDKGKNPLCFFPAEDVQRLTTSAESCKKYTQGLTHSDPTMTSECQGIQALVSTPECSVNMMPLEPSGNAEVEATRKRLEALKLLPVIEQVAKEEGVDARLIIAVISTESGGDATLLNQYGAVGLGQFKPDAARDMGLKPVNDACRCIKGDCHGQDVPACAGDARLDPAQNIRATAKYLKWLMSFNGIEGKKDSTRLAVASYNQGVGTILNAMKKTGNRDPMWEEVELHVNTEGRNYVQRVMQRYVAQGGSTASAFSDMRCNNVDIKELGTYSFTPSFSATVPDLLTAMERTVAFADETFKECDGSTPLDRCIKEHSEEFTRQSADLEVIDCASLNESEAVFSELSQHIVDCRENRQDNCACAWSPAPGSELRILLFGELPWIYLNGTAMHAQPIGQHKAWFSRDGTTTREARIDLLRNSSGTFMDVNELDGKENYAIDLPTEDFTIVKRDGKLVWTENPVMPDGRTRRMPACGEHKTNYHVCVRVKQEIPVLSKGTQLETPVIKFSLFMNDTHPPEPVQQMFVSYMGVATYTFTASASEDVSYYKVSCKPANAPEQKPIVMLGRKDGKRIDGQFMLNNCNGLPFGGQAYEIKVIPVDVAGNEGQAATCDTQTQQVTEAVTGVSLPACTGQSP